MDNSKEQSILRVCAATQMIKDEINDIISIEIKMKTRNGSLHLKESF